MVSLNLTLLIELGLFLLFMWGTSRFILPRVVQSLDERESSIEAHEQRAQADTERAVELEETYKHETSELHREAEERLRTARRSAQDRHTVTITSEKDRADEEVAEVRDNAAERVKEEREACAEIAPELAEAMLARLGIAERET